jgi:hypothetical protein
MYLTESHEMRQQSTNNKNLGRTVAFIIADT